MPTPFPGLTKVNVYGTWDKIDGSASSGTVRFVPRVNWIGDAADDVIIEDAAGITCILDANGHISQDLIAVDNPSLSSIDWTWHVTWQINGSTTSFDMDVLLADAGSGINLRTAAQVAASGGIFTPSTDAGDEIAFSMVLGSL